MLREGGDGVERGERVSGWGGGGGGVKIIDVGPDRSGDRLVKQNMLGLTDPELGRLNNRC